ncbi:hypothetical protein OAW23_06445 [Flavobacteriales bacterium]|nr:hypothetical protein [Flavobacteriales bacterium]
MKLFTSLLLAAATIASTMSFSKNIIPGEEWQRLGSRTVNMRADHDELPVTAFKGSFTKLKIRVKGAPIFVKNIRVIFGNGQDLNLKVGHKFTPGSERILDLPGNKRIIKKINFNYKTVTTSKGRAEVVIWGKR